MLQRIIDYVVGILIGGGLGLGIGVFAADPWDGLLVGGVVGIFVGACIRAWRTRDQRESYEDRSLADWTDD